jgi:DNA-directed RNA polymerase II subunit RPB3
MNPTVTNLSEENSYLRFRLSNINVSLANSLRRIILSEIPCIVFRTSPYEKNRVNIEINTSRINNELIKQRLSCIPIYINDPSFPIANYLVEINKQNMSDSIEFVTTKDIKIKDTVNDKYLSDAEVSRVFPPNDITGDYIDIVRLRPRLSDNIPGEHLKLNARFDIGTAEEDGAFNIVSTCSYAFAPDPVKINKEWSRIEADYKKQGLTKELIDFKKRDWLSLDAQRITMPDVFDFVIESVGQYTNMDIVYRATTVMISKLNKFKDDIQSNEDMVVLSDTTIPNSYDILLDDEGYTLGKAIEYMLYSKHFDRENARSDKIMTFCGFKKPHPHINNSLIRVAYIEEMTKEMVIRMLVSATDDLIKVYNNIGLQFTTET